MQNFECIECYDLTSEDPPKKAIRETCVDCHDEDEKDYGDVMNRWLRKYGGKFLTLSAQLEKLAARASVPGRKNRSREYLRNISRNP